MIRLERIVASLGGSLYEGGRAALIPGPGHSPKDRSVSLRLTQNGRLLIHCFSPKDDWREVRRLLAARGLLASAGGLGDCDSVPPKIRPSFEDKIGRAQAIWRESLPIAGTLAEFYLRRRSIRLAPLPEALRFHPRATSLEDRHRRPAMIAAICGPQGGLQGVQITLLAPDGEGKAAVTTPRRIVGRLLSGAVRLGGADPAPESLILAEGIETALSASEALSLPTWAALSASALPRLLIPDNVRALVVAADRGEAGEIAARGLSETLARRPIQIGIRFAPDGCQDWNDWAHRTS